jgi:predicted thioesterase
LVEVDKRRLAFRVQVFECAQDELGAAELVGDGLHQRAIIDAQRFSERVSQKLR